VPVCLAAIKAGTFTCMEVQATLFEPMWQVMLRRFAMGFSYTHVLLFSSTGIFVVVAAAAAAAVVTTTTAFSALTTVTK